jgi:N-acetylglucosaminyl-diphospho-decaprenol L-rhamnosyltransferase
VLTPDLSIVVLNYNTRDHLRVCLASIAAEGSTTLGRADAPYAAECIVVDNASTDGSANMVAAEFPWATLIRAPRNGGFAYGNNLAVPKTRGRSVLLLNPDTALPPGTLATLLTSLAEHPEAGIIGPKLLRPDGTIHLACRRSFPTPDVALFRLSGLSRLFPRSRLFGRYNLTFVDPDVPLEVDSVCGACLLIRRDTLERIGPLDERFFLYGEDLDWCLRAKQAGWTVRYEPAAVVRHQHGAASRQRALRTAWHFFRAMDLFYAKHYAHRYTPLLTGLVRLGIYLALALSLGRVALGTPARRRAARVPLIPTQRPAAP